MKPLVFAVALSAAVYGSGASADCLSRALNTLKNAPEVPLALEANFDTMRQVGVEIQSVIVSTESTLNQCSGAAFSARHRYVIHRIKSIAEDYNQQARLHNGLTGATKDRVANSG
jgi:hypothetical protein